MKKIGILFLLICLLTGCAAAQAAVLPDGLTVIEEQAFEDNAALTGVLSLPDRVSEVGTDAFSGTGLFAMNLPAATNRLGRQAFQNAAYLHIKNPDIVLEGLTGVHCLIGPGLSLVQDYAEDNDLLFVSETYLNEHDGYLYQEKDTEWMLICARDASSIGTSVTIPAQIDGRYVTSVTDFAFLGCTGLKEIRLPALLEEMVPADAFKDCKDARIVYYDDSQDLQVLSVDADISAGKVGDTITWQVETRSSSAVKTYAYTLYVNGKAASTQTTSSPTYTSSTLSAGSYQLSVEVTDEMGQTAKGTSQTLYIAVESMKMTVADTLKNGEDLVITVDEVPGAIHYSVYVTHEETGESIGYRTLSKPGKATFNGYLLQEGSYRVAGYVYGNDFRYAVPTVKIVTLSGDKAEGPVIPAFEPILQNNGGNCRICLSETDSFAVRATTCFADGTTSVNTYVGSANSDLWIYPLGSDDQWNEDGSLLLEGTIKQNGVWTAWGPVTEVTVLSSPKLSTPVLTLPETSVAGKDVTYSFTGSEHTQEYQLKLVKGYNPSKEPEDYNDDETLDWYNWNKDGTYVLPGYLLSEGTYTLFIDCWAEGYRWADTVRSKLVVSGTQPTAPSVQVSKTEMSYKGDSVSLAIQAAGAAGASIERKITGYGRFDPETIALDENGYGIYNRHMNFEEPGMAGQTLTFNVSVIIDGVWSETASVDVLLKEAQTMAETVITAPDTLPAGQDLSFRFSAVENATEYRAYLYQAYSNDWFYSFSGSTCMPDKDQTMPGHYLMQGSYRIRVVAKSASGSTSETTHLFSVTGTRPAAPSVEADLSDIHIKDKALFTIDTAGAETVYYKYSSTPSATNNTYSSSGKLSVLTDTTTWSYTFQENAVGADFTFQFTVKKDGKWSAWKTLTCSVQELPPLDPPVIHGSTSFLAGEDMTFTFDAVEHATAYTYQFTHQDGNCTYGSSFADPKPITFNGCDYNAGTYELEVFALSDEYESSSSVLKITVTGTRPEAPSVSVDKTNVLINETHTFTIQTANVQEVYYRCQENTTLSGSSGTINVLEDTTLWSTYHYYAGTFHYVFSVLIDGRWTAWSSPITVTVSKPETMAAPVITMPSSLALGKDLTVSAAAVTGATSYSITLYNNRNVCLFSTSSSTTAGITAVIDGFRFPAAGTYTVTVQARSSNASSTATASVTVSGDTRPTAPTVTAQTDLGRVNIKYGFTLNTQGADKAAVRYYRVDNTNDVTYKSFDITGDATTWQDSKSTSGQTWNYAFAILKDGVWSPWSTNLPISITNREQLAAAVLQVPASVSAGEDVYLSFTEVNHADSYTMYLYSPNGNYTSWTAYPDVQRRLMGYDLTPGTYRVVVKAYGAEYDPSTSEQTFQIAGSFTDAPSVSVDKTEVHTDSTYTFVIDSTDAQEIAYKAVMNNSTSRGTLNVLSDFTVWDTESYYAGIRHYSFSVLKDGRWSAWSTPIAVTILERPALTDPVFSTPSSLTVGQDLEVTVEKVEGASYYYVNLYNNRGQTAGYRYLSSPGTATFAGYLLYEGSWRVEVEAYSSNSGSSRLSRPVAINAAPVPDAPQVTPPESTSVAPQTYFTFTLNTENAEKAAVRFYRIGSPNDVSYSNITVSADAATTTWRDMRYNSGYSYAYSFAVKTDGVWSAWSEFTEITIQ